VSEVCRSYFIFVTHSDFQVDSYFIFRSPQ
jgi:hypothetical protein